MDGNDNNLAIYSMIEVSQNAKRNERHIVLLRTCSERTPEAVPQRQLTLFRGLNS